KEHPRSWRNFPLRLAEAGEVHRHEPSGTLHGLFRVRAFRQDDAHIFVREEQVEEEIKNIVTLTLKFYEMMGFPEVEVELSTRPEKYIGSRAVWTKAENTLAKVLKDLNIKFKLNKGDGAFYGPKIDFHIKDSASRLWQCGTIQLDFFMPERFELEYADKDGLKKRPIMIHRTVIGSIQRFAGIIIEHFKGAFPFWLAPVQVAVLSINEKVNDYAEKVLKDLKNNNIRAELDLRNESINKKILEAELQKIPYLLVIGEKEAAAGKVAVRERGRGDLGQTTLEKFLTLAK
ncbi:threonine--tRNA ligase, partial [Candidatus Giovannonibacteria bacterium]|nr:threonine--tRNA ligase [Candidatus Giovannonibacteria bacterium]